MLSRPLRLFVYNRLSCCKKAASCPTFRYLAPPFRPGPPGRMLAFVGLRGDELVSLDKLRCCKCKIMTINQSINRSIERSPNPILSSRLVSSPNISIIHTCAVSSLHSISECRISFLWPIFTPIHHLRNCVPVTSGPDQVH
jgi:hypothetical protein